MARYLGPNNFGVLSYAFSLVALFQFMVSLGLEKIVVRSIIKKKADANSTLGSAFVLKITGSTFLLLTVFIVLYFTKNSFKETVIVVIIAVGMLFSPFKVIELFFQSQSQFRFIAIANSVSVISSSILKLFLILLQADLVWFAAAAVGEQLILGIILIFFYTKFNISIFQWKFDYSVANDLFANSWPLLLSSMTIMIYMRIDQVMIKLFLGVEAVGIYSAAVKISELWYFIPVAINQAIFPALISTKRCNHERYIKNLQHLYDMMVWIAFAISFAIWLFSEPLISNLFGYQYIEASSVLAIHVWSCIFVFLGVSNTNWILIENLQIYSFYRTLIVAVVNVLLNFILIPNIGVRGAALATLISYAIASYFSMFFFRPSRLNFYLSSKSFNPLTVFRRTKNIYKTI